MEFKGHKGTFGAGMVCGEIPGDTGGRGLSGKEAMSRAGKRSLGDQPDKKNPDTTREQKGRTFASSRSLAKVNNKVQNVESTSNLRTNSRSKGVYSNRVMTNKSIEVVSNFKKAKMNK
jgi:hypothetical protein